MKLKGKNAKKLKGINKAKMEKTLKRMEKVRVEDGINLRAKINAKITGLISEKEKADKYIDNLKNKIIELENMSLRIEGALVALKEVSLNETVAKNDTDV